MSGFVNRIAENKTLSEEQNSKNAQKRNETSVYSYESCLVVQIVIDEYRKTE